MASTRSSRDRASVFGTEGWGFESLRVRHPRRRWRTGKGARESRRPRWRAPLLFLLLARPAAAQSAPPATPALPERPNIVLLIGDDQGYGDLGFMGSKLVRTPRLDSLAEEGVVCRLGYATSSACRRSLRTLLTGLEPDQWTAHVQAARAARSLRPRAAEILAFDTVPERLARRGYASFQGGKFWEGSYRDGGFTDGMSLGPGARGLSPIEREQGDLGLVLARETMQPVFDFIDAHREQPFFLWFAPKLPHLPHDAGPELLALYDDPRISAAGRAYYANVTRFDGAVGALVDHLERRGLRKRTLLVYLADHGWEQPPDMADPGSLGGERGKLSLGEAGFRTPLVFDWPGVLPSGTELRGPVSTTDVIATCLDLAGLEPDPSLPGMSLRSALLEGRPSPRASVIASMDKHRLPAGVDPLTGEIPVAEERGFCLRSADWRYVRYQDQGLEELFRIEEDPGETKNVAAEHPEVLARLRAEVDAWWQAIGLREER